MAANHGVGRCLQAVFIPGSGVVRSTMGDEERSV